MKAKIRSIYLQNFVYAFLLLASKQICNLAMGITGKVIELLQISSALEFFNPRPKYVRYQLKRKMAYSIVVGLFSFQIYKTAV